MLPSFRVSIAAAALAVLILSLAEGLRVDDVGVGYYERMYSDTILSLHVRSSEMTTLLDSRVSEGKFLPEAIDGFGLQLLSFFNIRWQENPTNLTWIVLYDLDVDGFNSTIPKLLKSTNLRVKQVESYESEVGGPTLYAVILLHKDYWPAGTSFDAKIAMKWGPSYCCNDASRFIRQRLDYGFRPTSLSLARDEAGVIRISDSWDSVGVNNYQAGINKSFKDLQQLVQQQLVKTAMVPVYLQAYRNISDITVFSYIAYPGNPSGLTVTTGHSRSGFQFLLEIIPTPPLVFTAYQVNSELDLTHPEVGEQYTAIWRLPSASELHPTAVDEMFLALW
eukprot:TRINITY_DN2016_c0_g2_i1.p1 TRINITY_DN2016_c0_g2~~TRINITY_DN2016_c0_g2_i1.p1  ORF type:complete len:335 (+),score=74.16 TRINITY_DN2016_c0_g2_i1:63-1067(+)